MKIKMLVLGLLICLVVSFFGREYTSAQSSEPVVKIGIISVDQVLLDCKATAKFREQLIAENKKMTAEEEKLSLEIKALMTGLQSGALKVGSSDYMAQYKEMMQKQSDLKFLEDYNPRQSALRQQQWTQEFYKKVLKVTEEVGKEKGLILVLEKSKPEFPIQNEIGMVISTYKVLYSGGCLDITDDVVAKLDAEETESEN